MRLILDKTKLDNTNVADCETIVNLPFELCTVTVEYDYRDNKYYLEVTIYRHSYKLCWNSDKQSVLNAYNRMLQAYYNGDKYHTFTWNP